MTGELSKEEKAVIAALRRTASKWPKGLWLYSASGTLWVMKKDRNNQRAILENGSFDPDYAVAQLPIENDGGDW